MLYTPARYFIVLVVFAQLTARYRPSEEKETRDTSVSEKSLRGFCQRVPLNAAYHTALQEASIQATPSLHEVTETYREPWLFQASCAAACLRRCAAESFFVEGFDSAVAMKKSCASFAATGS